MAYNVIQDPVFKPAVREITAITNAFPALVTTSFDNSYINGLIGRLIIPVNFGMQQANQLEGEITIVSPTQFTIDIDTTNMDPFVIPPPQPGNNYTPAQITIIGEINSILTGAVQNVLPPLI